MTEDTESAELRRRIQHALGTILRRGHQDGSVRVDVNASTVVRFGAMLAQPMSNVPGWTAAAADQRAVFLRGIAPGRD